MIRNQDEIDRLIEEVHAGAPPDHGEYGDEESKRCELVIADDEPILILTELPPMEWSPDLVDEIADNLEEDRIKGLRAGSPLTKEEADLWDSAWGEMAASGIVTVEVFRVIHSRQPHLRAYVGRHHCASGQAWETLAWVGPFPDVERLPAFAIAQSEEWVTIGLTFDPLSILEIERVTDADAQSKHWDETDREQADFVFQAVKADRAVRVRPASGGPTSVSSVE